MTERTHCLNRDACAAKTPTTHCRDCSLRRMHASPEIQAKRMAAVRAYNDKPGVKAKQAEIMKASFAKAMANPSHREWLRENGRRLYAEVLSRPDVMARTLSDEANARRSASKIETHMSWCPPHLRGEYARLIRGKRLPAAEARAIIEAEIEGSAAHAKRAVENAALAMRLKHERDLRERY